MVWFFATFATGLLLAVIASEVSNVVAALNKDAQRMLLTMAVNTQAKWKAFRRSRRRGAPGGRVTRCYSYQNTNEYHVVLLPPPHKMTPRQDGKCHADDFRDLTERAKELRLVNPGDSIRLNAREVRRLLFLNHPTTRGLDVDAVAGWNPFVEIHFVDALGKEGRDILPDNDNPCLIPLTLPYDTTGRATTTPPSVLHTWAPKTGLGVSGTKGIPSGQAMASPGNRVVGATITKNGAPIKLAPHDNHVLFSLCKMWIHSNDIDAFKRRTPFVLRDFMYTDSVTVDWFNLETEEDVETDDDDDEEEEEDPAASSTDSLRDGSAPEVPSARKSPESMPDLFEPPGPADTGYDDTLGLGERTVSLGLVVLFSDLKSASHAVSIVM